MLWEVSLSGTGTRVPDGYGGYTLVSGGCDTCSGSHLSYLEWSVELPTASGDFSFLAPDPPLQEIPIQTKLIGDALGINPKDIREGLLIWHPMHTNEIGLYEDYSGNGKNAIASGPMAAPLGKYGYAASLSDYPYEHIEVTDFNQISGTYMVSFWFKPTELLTSGTISDPYYRQFIIMDASSFYGDHFKDVWDYKAYSLYKGWYRMNTHTTCSAGYNSNYLRMQGSSNTTWFGNKWDAATLYFKIDKSWSWDIEAKFTTAELTMGQSVGLIFFNESSYLDYCSMALEIDSVPGYYFVDSSIPVMTGRSSPSPYSVAESSYYQNNEIYAGWRTFESTAGGSYYHSGDGALPDWVRIDLGASTTKVIQGYRIRRYGIHFPKDWTFQGSNDGTNFTTLHTMVGQPDLADGTWTSWFYFINTTVYRYYRFYITKSATGTSWVCWDGTEFYVKERLIKAEDDNIKLRTRDLIYRIPSPTTTSGTWLFAMQKRGQYVSFSYRREDQPAWVSPIYRMDTSLWGANMRIGVQSSNLYGIAPEVYFDYVRFKRGKKPDGWGDPEGGGRLQITYNLADYGNVVEDREDSRIWINSGYGGFSYGTATYRWDPNQWYLIQFGLKSNAQYDQDEYCWWVNTRCERGLVLGSGINQSAFIPSGTNLSYFDPEPYTTNSGSFILDEVSHWSRWLTAEEILKMWNHLSQIAWHKAEPYLLGSENLLAADFTLTSQEVIQAVPFQKRFEWFTQYQSPLPPQIDIRIEKISYRIQKELKVISAKIGTFTVNIFRCTSGWIANNLECFSCVDSDFCKCDVRGNVSVYTRDFNYPEFTLNIYEFWGFIQKLIPEITCSTNSVKCPFVVIMSSVASPALTFVNPAKNARMIETDLSNYPVPTLYIESSTFANDIRERDNRVWIKRRGDFKHSFISIDNFCYYTVDFLDPMVSGTAIPAPYVPIIEELAGTTSLSVTLNPVFFPNCLETPIYREGWGAVNLERATRFDINKGMSYTVFNNYFGEEFSLTQSGTMTDLMYDLERESRTNEARVYMNGTNCFTLEANNFETWPSGVFSNPFLFTKIPCTVTGWEFSTEVKFNMSMYYGGWVGLMCANPFTGAVTKFLVGEHGFITRPDSPNDMGFVYSQAIADLNFGDSVFMRIRRVGGTLVKEWSLDNNSWTAIDETTYSELYLNMTSNNTPAPYVASCSRALHTIYTIFNYSWTPHIPDDTKLVTWFQIDLGQPVTVAGFRFQVPTYNWGDWSNRDAPLTLQVNGSLDGSTWVNIRYGYTYADAHTGEGWVPSLESFIKFSSTVTYRYYHINNMRDIFNDTNIRVGRFRFIVPVANNITPNLITSGIIYMGLTAQPIVGLGYLGSLDSEEYLLDNLFVQTKPIAAIPQWAAESYPGYRMLDGEQTTEWQSLYSCSQSAPPVLGTNEGDEYIDFDFGSKVRLAGFKMYLLGSIFLEWWSVWVSNDFVNWTVWQWLQEPMLTDYWVSPTQVWMPYNNRFFRLNNLTNHRYLRILFTNNRYHYKSRISEIIFYAHILPGDPLDTKISITAEFPWAKLVMNDANTLLRGDEWEPILVGTECMNSIENSGYSVYTKLYDDRIRLGYSPTSDFVPEERVFVRTEFVDEPQMLPPVSPLDEDVIFSFHFGAPPDVFISSNMPIDEVLGATVSGIKVYSSNIIRTGGGSGSQPWTGLSSTHNSSSLSSLFDGNSSTSWASGVAPYVASIFIMFTNVGYTASRAVWRAVRFMSQPNTTYWKTDFPRDVAIYTSDVANPSITNESHWYHQFTITFLPPAGPTQWGNWVYFPFNISAIHYRIKFVSNWTTTNGNWIVISAMEVLADAILDSYDDNRTQYVSTYMTSATDVRYQGSASLVKYHIDCHLYTEEVDSALINGDWTFSTWVRVVPVADGSKNTNIDYATPIMTSATSPKPCIVMSTGDAVECDAQGKYVVTKAIWKAFDRTNEDQYDKWVSAFEPEYLNPVIVFFDFGTNKGRAINKYAFLSAFKTWCPGWDYPLPVAFPRAWALQGTNSIFASLEDSVNANEWVTLDTRSNIPEMPDNTWSSYYVFSNDVFYEKYRILFYEPNYKGVGDISGFVALGQIKFVDCLTALPSTDMQLIHFKDPYAVTKSALKISFQLDSFEVFKLGAKIGKLYPVEFNHAIWSHISIVKQGNRIYGAYNGKLISSFVDMDSSVLITGTSGYLSMFVGYMGYIDNIEWAKGVLWESDFVKSKRLDEVYTFKIVGHSYLSVNFNIINDVNSPVVLPLTPAPLDVNICPASGIYFRIVDDYAGVYWDRTKIIIDDVTVYSGGNNMCDYYPDRGILNYYDFGKSDGEWSDRQLAGPVITDSGTASYEYEIDGINRYLYPPSTVYSGSGAWGREFEYFIQDNEQIELFGKRMYLTLSGTDSVGYGLQFDAIVPNTFEYSYYFDYIPNDNIQVGNFFLNVGESERIDILQAMDKHIWVDIWDADYPATDIVEEECQLLFTDGVVSQTCSGVWFTTYTGAGGMYDEAPSGILIHRMHYDAGDYYWDGHRTMTYTVHAENNNPMCRVYNRFDYGLLYGWHLFWHHTDRIKPFEFNKKLPVFVTIKTQDYIPSRYGKSYMLWTAPALTSEHSVEIKALPLGTGNVLEVDLLADSYYLQYSEWITVEVYCKDMDGNELNYTWRFKTEDMPR